MATVASPRRPSRPKAAHVVTLALAIDHQCYGVSPIRGIADPDVVKAFRLEKKSDRDAVYDVALTVRGLECDCPDFEARHRGLPTQGCKHIRALVELGLLDRPTAPSPRVADEFDVPAAPACCAPAEPAPCEACTPAVVDDATARTIEAAGILEADGWHPAIARFLGGNPEVAAAVTPEAVNVAIDPPAPVGTMTLAGWIAHVAAGFTGLDTQAGDLVAETLAALARDVELTKARDVPTYRDRIATYA